MNVGGAVAIDAAGDSIALSGALTGNGSLTEINAGTLILSGSNTYSGGTTVTAGKLVVLSRAALPGGSSWPSAQDRQASWFAARFARHDGHCGSPSRERCCWCWRPWVFSSADGHWGQAKNSKFVGGPRKFHGVSGNASL